MYSMADIIDQQEEGLIIGLVVNHKFVEKFKDEMNEARNVINNYLYKLENGNVIFISDPIERQGLSVYKMSPFSIGDKIYDLTEEEIQRANSILEIIVKE